MNLGVPWHGNGPFSVVNDFDVLPLCMLGLPQMQQGCDPSYPKATKPVSMQSEPSMQCEDDFLRCLLHGAAQGSVAGAPGVQSIQQE